MTKSSEIDTEIPSPRATYQDVLNAPPDLITEIVDGILYTFSRPAVPQDFAYSGLGGIMSQSFQYGRGGPGGWWILSEPEVHLSAEILVPDIAGWRRERVATLPPGAYHTVAPDWICEVLSPSTEEHDRGRKQKVYAREGVDFLWFVDPIARSLEAYRLRGTEWELIGELYNDAQVSLPPFEAIIFDLSDLWLPPIFHRGTPMTEQSDRLATESEPAIIETSK